MKEDSFKTKISSKWNIGSNIQAILKAKVEVESNQFKSLPWFVGEVGKKYTIRFLPLSLIKEDYELPWFSVKLHRNLIAKNKFIGLVCPRSVGVGECPVCEWINENYANIKESNDQAAQILLNNLYGKKRYFSVIYNKDSGKIEKFEYSEELKNQIIADISEDNPVDFSNLISGFYGKLLYSKTVTGKKPSFMFEENPSPIAKTDKEIEKIVSEFKEYKDDIIRFITPLSYEKLSDLLDKLLSTEPEDDEHEGHEEGKVVIPKNNTDISTEDLEKIIDENEEIPF